MEFYKILEAIMKEKHLTIPDVARTCGLSDSTVRSMFDRKQKKIALEVAFKISRGLNVSLERLNGEDILDNSKENLMTTPLSQEHQNLIKKYRDLDRHGKKVVNVVLDVEHERCTTPTLPQSDEEDPNIIELDFPYQTASAGTGDFADDNSHEKLAVRLNENTRRADYLMRVNGDSMQPRFQDGDILLVHSQPSIENNEIGIFIINGERLVKQQGIGQLISLNPNYENIPINECNSVYCRGKVIGVLDLKDIV